MTIEHMNLHYGDFHALKDINLTLQPGYIMGLIGVNGTGKTTLLDVLSGKSGFDGDVSVYRTFRMWKIHPFKILKPYE